MFQKEWESNREHVESTYQTELEDLRADYEEKLSKTKLEWKNKVRDKTKYCISSIKAPSSIRAPSNRAALTEELK